MSTAQQVVVYDDCSGAYAVRLWWMLRWLGHQAVAVLDGGWSRWLREARPVSTQQPDPLPATFVAQPNPELIVTTEQIAAALGTDRYRLLDVRTRQRYQGEQEPIDPVAGHIPGAVNAPYPEYLDDQGNLLPAERLRTELLRATGGRSAQRVMCMCGSGVTAGIAILALEIAAMGEARLYPGSWSEWIRDPRRPVATGAEP